MLKQLEYAFVDEYQLTLSDSAADQADVVAEIQLHLTLEAQRSKSSTPQLLPLYHTFASVPL
jgi:hypothetical protein